MNDWLKGYSERKILKSKNKHVKQRQMSEKCQHMFFF